MEGGSGGPPAGKISKIEANCKHFRVFWCHFSVTTMKDFLILQQSKKMLRSGTRILYYPPSGKISKIEANCKHFQAFGAISV